MRKPTPKPINNTSRTNTYLKLQIQIVFVAVQSISLARNYIKYIEEK